MIFKLIGLIISLATLALALLLQGKVNLYLDIPSAIIMTGTFIGGAIFGYGNNIFSFIKNSRQNRISSSDLFITLDFYNYLTRLTFYASLFSFIIASILLLAQSDDITKIGPNLALSLLTCIYGLIIAYLILQPVKHGVLYQNMKSNGQTDKTQL